MLVLCYKIQLNIKPFTTIEFWAITINICYAWVSHPCIRWARGLAYRRGSLIYRKVAKTCVGAMHLTVKQSRRNRFKGKVYPYERQCVVSGQKVYTHKITVMDKVFWVMGIESHCV